MTAELYLAEVFYLRYDFYLRKKYDCKIILSWTDCKSKLDQQCKQTLKYGNMFVYFWP